MINEMRKNSMPQLAVYRRAQRYETRSCDRPKPMAEGGRQRFSPKIPLSRGDQAASFGVIVTV
jgi:hypothetical protein